MLPAGVLQSMTFAGEFEDEAALGDLIKGGVCEALASEDVGPAPNRSKSPSTRMLCGSPSSGRHALERRGRSSPSAAG